MSSPPIPVPAAAGVISGLLTFLVGNAQGVSPGTGFPLAVIIGIVIYYFTFVITQQPTVQPTEAAKPPKKKAKQDKKKPAASSSSAASDDEETASKKNEKKSKKAQKAAAAAAIAAAEEEGEASEASASEDAEGDDDDDSSANLSKNAKKKAKKKAKELAAKKEEEKKAAAAAASKKVANKKEEKKQAAPAPAPAPAPAAKKEKKSANKETVSAPSPAPVPVSPVAHQEEDFQQSKSDKKKNKKDEKKKREEEAKLTQPKASEAPKTPTPISPAVAAPVKESKKHESKSQSVAAAALALSPPPAAEFEEGEWNVAKAARPTSAQKQANKAAESKAAESSSASSSSSEPADYVEIPVSKVAAIIGSKGTVLKALQEGTHATIEVPKAAERDLQSLTARILIRGDPEHVKYAKICVKSLAEKGFSPVTHPGFVSDDVYVESKLHGMIIGNKGSTLKSIQAKTGTMIRMPERGGNDRLVIVGPKDGVKAAKDAIKQLVTEGFSPLTHEGQEKKEIEFPSEKFGILIGPNGQTIKSIQGSTKTQIKIPSKDSATKSVIVIGPAAGVAQAEKEILRLLQPKNPKKADDTKDEENAEAPSTSSEDAANPEAAAAAEAPQSAYDAWNAAEVPQTNEDALWASNQ